MICAAESGRELNTITETLDFKVIGEQTIHCASCEQRSGNALRRLPGVEHAQASVQTQQVKVTIDPNQVSLQQVRANLEQFDYEALPTEDSK